MSVSFRALTLAIAIGLFAVADSAAPVDPAPVVERGKCVENCV